MKPINKKEQNLALKQQNSASFNAFCKGYGLLRHSSKTLTRIFKLIQELHFQGKILNIEKAFSLLNAADSLTSAAMWLVVHATYATKVNLSGAPMLSPLDFKIHPEGHTGGSLNMVPAYVGYLLANALTGETRSWIMGQGHCVSAVDSVNLLTRNLSMAHHNRYPLSEEGLSKFVQDFYSYQLTPQGKPVSPLGSHVNAYTAGSVLEGGYLGFAELQYVHMPLPGESLVAFLSDGAFEEQRGSDWAPRWWRAQDTGMVCPILICNGRRIEQRSTIVQEGGTPWLIDFLRLHGFNPIVIDGRDPAAYAWAILSSEKWFIENCLKNNDKNMKYPISMPYIIAETVKGFGFPGAGTNLAHNLPLQENPHHSEQARRIFNKGAQRLFVRFDDLIKATNLLNNHSENNRPKEKDHPIAKRDVDFPIFPTWPIPSSPNEHLSPMQAMDGYFLSLVKCNPSYRVRIGNPDELKSNGMQSSLEELKHRVCQQPELGNDEAIDGKVITVLNEEAVICAALGNKAGLNLAVTYEAFGVKMLGALRQEIIFSRKQKEAGIPPGWLSVPIVLTSHTWENGKNEQSHQDPTLSEALLGEMNDVCRVSFPADWNTTLATLESCYSQKGIIHAMILPKRPVPSYFSIEQALIIAKQGGLRIESCSKEHVSLIAIGAYQLIEAAKASIRLKQKGISHSLIYLAEPGKFRIARDSYETQCLTDLSIVQDFFPISSTVRIFFCHTRPHVMAGILRHLDTGATKTHFLGYLNQGGTLDTFGMLFANRCTYAHGLACVSKSLDIPIGDLLTPEEFLAISMQGNPRILDIPFP